MFTDALCDSNHHVFIDALCDSNHHVFVDALFVIASTLKSFCSSLRESIGIKKERAYNQSAAFKKTPYM